MDQPFFMPFKRRIVTDPLPRPREVESKSEYLMRFQADKGVKQAYDSPARRTVAAEAAWSRAKDQSMVSITTSYDSFLLFGDPQS